MSYFIYADDDSDDRELFCEIMSMTDIHVPVMLFETGIALRQYFNDNTEREQPACIVLDLNMPGFSGLETLRWLKSHPSLRHLPVVILSTSSNPRDKLLAQQYGADDFLTKPIGIRECREVGRQLLKYALRRVRA